MREILFRGKDIKGIWHIGLLAHIGNAWYISNKAGVSTAFEVIPSTVGQYTGLTDKNGKKIFEGDIVQHDFGTEQIGKQNAVVEYRQRYAGFMIKPLDNWMYCEKADCIVIGNIHDNSELLGGE